MRTLTRFIIGAASAATLSLGATAQPGTRNAIVYGARAPGESTWHFGSFALESSDSDPLTFEIGAFFFRAQGYGLARAVYKTYIDGVSAASGDSAAIIEDITNGIPASGVDGRVGVFNNGLQVQRVFTTRHASIPGSGFRISSSADSTDSTPAGGISVKQAPPVDNPAFETADGVLGFRFDLTLSCTAGLREVLIDTPHSRITSYTTFNAADSFLTLEWKAVTGVDPITLRASWVPAPPALGILLLSGLIAGRRR